MLFRFSLYGFLKNQRYFEPFIVLFFLQSGLDFLHIGWLVAVREICLNLLESPSGAMADTYGRRKVMIGSFTAYLASFAIFAGGSGFSVFAIAMVLYAVGDALRTGTHKAMIFAWLHREGRLHEKTRVYGLTRSWSKIGSAVSVVLATIFVLTTRNYRAVFLLAMIPYALGILNFLKYPAWLDGQGPRSASARAMAGSFRETLELVARRKSLRRLILESMSFEGTFKSCKDYLQPVIQQAVIGWALLTTVTVETRTTLLIGAVYLVLHLLSAASSRNAHLLVQRSGGEARAVYMVWILALVVYLVMIPALLSGWAILAIGLFVILNILQNFFRPIQISRFESYADDNRTATILSIESQANSLATIILAPLLGFAIDYLAARGAADPYWPIGLMGAVLAAGVLVSRLRSTSLQDSGV